MIKKTQNFSDAPSSFLSRNMATCPESLLNLAQKNSPSPFIFVRAIGTAVLQTARDAMMAGLVRPILVGETGVINRDAEKIGFSLEGVEVICASGELDAIEKSIRLFNAGGVFGLVKGQLHTDVFMSEIVKRKSGIRGDERLVHVFAMLPPMGGRPLLISDAAVNVSPNIETRVDAALSMAKLLRRLGVPRPRVAILSATESVLDSVPSSVEALEIAERARLKDKEAEFFGPLSFDLAISPKAAEMKNIENKVAGMADALVVPDIVSGNILFKCLVWCSGGLAAGVVLGGNIPVVLTSRADPPAARLASIALASIYDKK